MTKQESNRLAIVETKMNSIVLEIVSLKEFLIEKINATDRANAITMAGQDKAIAIAMTASEKAIGKAEVANDLKFSEVDRRYNDSMVALNASIKTLTESKDLNAGAKTGTSESKTGVKDIIVYILFAMTAISFIISMYTR